MHSATKINRPHFVKKPNAPSLLGVIGFLFRYLVSQLCTACVLHYGAARQIRNKRPIALSPQLGVVRLLCQVRGRSSIHCTADAAPGRSLFLVVSVSSGIGDPGYFFMVYIILTFAFSLHTLACILDVVYMMFGLFVPRVSVPCILQSPLTWRTCC